MTPGPTIAHTAVLKQLKPRKLRNEMLALHGYPFKDSVLSRYYNARKWYKMDPAFDSTKFSPGDIRFLENLDRIEAGLKIKK